MKFFQRYLYKWNFCFYILLKKYNFIYNSLYCCDHTCYCVGMISVMSASPYVPSESLYHPLYQSRSSMYIRDLIPRNFAVSAEAVPIDTDGSHVIIFKQII